ncbi:MAG TPA: secretin N-terminal domain-containing protein [Candidatus Binatia bacterium]|nr:secretin N-terminal domain-containing protein [Candidatus Binatia bacterium]
MDTQSTTNKSSSTNEIQLSFQGANIEMVVQWLAQNTGKSVIKHPQVQCQLTIMSSKKVTPREAITLVYRALALEGFTTIESSNSILIVPEGKEPKLNPEVLDGSRKDIPEGRQRLVKIFPLAHLQAADVRDKVRGVLSDKGTIDIDERANQLIVTDYNDNLRLLAELIGEFDVSASGLTIQIYPLKHADADDLGSLLNVILNAQSGGSGSSGRSSSSGRNSSGPMGGPPFGGPPSSDSGGSSSPPSGGAGSQPPTQQVRIWPDRTSNRLIVSAPKSRLPEIERLLEILDTDKSEDVTVRMIPLKNVNAADLVREIGPLYQKLGGKGSKDTIEIAANDRSNSLIVLSSEANFRAIEKLITGLDTEDALEKITRTFPLKNADAEDVARQLQDLMKDQDNSSRYPFYYFSSSRGGGSSGKKMSVVSDRRRNSLIIQAPPAQMDSIQKMIAELDEPVSDDSLAPRIYPLKYVSAVDIEEVLNELFLKKTQQRTYWDFFSDNPSEPTADRDVGRLYGKVRITSEPYSNTIIVTSNSKESLAVVEDVLKQLDAPSQAGETTLRVQLKFAKAANVANNINILFAKNGSPPLRPVNQQQQPQQNNQQQQQQQGTSSSYQTSFSLEQETKEEGYYPWLGGQPDNPRSSDGRNATRPVSDLVGRVRAVADLRSNSLLISANVHFFPQVMKLLEELDAPTAQVLIEARIVEVSSDYLDKLGVRWSPDGSKVFTTDDYDNSILAHASAQYQKGFGGLTTVNSPSSTTLPSTLSQLRSGVLDSTINMDFLVQFLRKTTAAKVLAEPQINIADNERGQLFVGQQVPFIDKSQTTDVGALNQSFQYKDVGVVLEVTPHININGDVALKVRAESSAIVPGQTLFGGALIDTREFRTDLKAKSGETLVLGGIIQNQVSDTLRKTPILGDIPGLGWAFKKKDKTSHEVELMVFLRPKVTRTPEEAKELLQEIYKKAPNVKEFNDDPESKKSKKPEKKEDKDQRPS